MNYRHYIISLNIDIFKINIIIYFKNLLFYKYNNLMSDQDSNSDSDDSINVVRPTIIFVGDAGVGKTSIISRIMDNTFKSLQLELISCQKA